MLERVGPYDPEFRMGYEDVDYCLRVFQAGFACVYEPAISAIHHESLFRSRPDEKLHALAGDEPRPPARRSGPALPVAELARERSDGRASSSRQSADASCYHRIMLPALALGCDWCGLDAPPPQIARRPRRGRVRATASRTSAATTVVVVQTPAQDGLARR